MCTKISKLAAHTPQKGSRLRLAIHTIACKQLARYILVVHFQIVERIFGKFCNYSALTPFLMDLPTIPLDRILIAIYFFAAAGCCIGMHVPRFGIRGLHFYQRLMRIVYKGQIRSFWELCPFLHKCIPTTYDLLPKREKTGTEYHKINEMVLKYTYKNPLKYTKCHKIFKHLPLQDPTIFTQIEIFGLKIYHQATLNLSCQNLDNTF
jgi:hypothetical protein